MNRLMFILILILKYFNTQEYIPLKYYLSTNFILINPCSIEKSILIRKNFLYKFDQNEKRLCILKKFFSNQKPIVNSIAYLNNDLLLIINGNLFRTQELINLTINNEIIYQLIHYSNVPILSDKIDYVFTTPCCTCRNSHLISREFNEYIILANKSGDVILFYLKSMTIVYNFENIFQIQSICQSNPCEILYLGLLHSHPILICVIQYQTEKAIIFQQSFLESNSLIEKIIYLNFTGQILYITPSSMPNSYYFWDKKTIYYTINGGKVLSKIPLNGCQINYLNNMNKYQLEIYYKNLHIHYDDLILQTKKSFCFNFTIHYIVLSKNEFFILTNNNEWLYGKESLLSSLIHLKDQCYLNLKNEFIPKINFQCLINQSNPCSDSIQSFCLYQRFQPLFNINQIYILEKNMIKSFQFIFQGYTIIPIMINSIKSKFFNYSINYIINRLNNGIIQIIGNILVSTMNQINNDFFSSSLNSIRLDLLQYGYSCLDPPSFSFQIEISCSSRSIFRVEEDDQLNYWNHTDTLQDIQWIEENLPLNIYRQFSPIYLKHKSIDPLILKYQYCFNDTCQYLNNNSIIIYAIPLNKNDEYSAYYLFNRTNSCLNIHRLIYRLWIKSILNKKELFQIPYKRNRFYQILLNLLSISNKSCLFFHNINPIYINQTINQISKDYLKFILHIIAYNNSYSFCDLETFLLIEIELIHNYKNSYRSLIFFLTFILFIFFIHLYIYYKNQQRKIYLEYYRLNQIDAGQLHQWHDIARYLNSNNKNSNNSLKKYLIDYYYVKKKR